MSLSDLLSLEPDPYLDQLTRLPLSSLKTEPVTLKTQSHHLSSSLSALTQASYPTFLSLHRASATLDTHLASFSDSLDSLLHHSLPNLDQSLSTWSDTTDSLLNHRNSARQVLDQHDKLRDLLDIPLLIDTCVRNAYFAEALSLISHASALSSSSSPSPILRSLQAQVHLSNTHMLLALLTTLHDPTRKLPALWKVVNFLRRMSVFDSDAQIAAAFLGARESCLKSALDASDRHLQALISFPTPDTSIAEKDRDDIARCLRKYIDIWREGVHDIITQFTTIFLDKKPAPGTTAMPLDPHLRTLLTTYTSYALTTHLLPALRSLLPLVPSALPSLLTQLTYCATAFASIGMDFRPLLNDLFSTAVRTSTHAQFTSALTRFTVKFSTTSTKPSTWIRIASAKQTSSSQPVHPHIPPASIAAYPPLAGFLNDILNALNALRLLAPIDIMADLLLDIEDVLAQGLRGFVAYARDSPWQEAEEERAVLNEAGNAYMEMLVPFVRRALVEGVYAGEMAEVNMSEGLRDALEDFIT